MSIRETRMMSTGMVGKILGMDQRSVWELCVSGEIPSIRLTDKKKGRFRISEADLEAWIESRRVKRPLVESPQLSAAS